MRLRTKAWFQNHEEQPRTGANLIVSTFCKKIIFTLKYARVNLCIWYFHTQQAVSRHTCKIYNMHVNGEFFTPKTWRLHAARGQERRCIYTVWKWPQLFFLMGVSGPPTPFTESRAFSANLKWLYFSYIVLCSCENQGTIHKLNCT